MRLGAIVLAAGASVRMGRPKSLLLTPSGETFVGRIHAALAAAGLDPVVIVTREDLEEAIAAAVPRARIVVNVDPGRGQLSSLLVGLDELAPRDAAMVTLVDLPLVRVETVQAIVEAWRRSRASLVRPLHAGRHGHPVIFGATLLAALRHADPIAGAKPVVHAFAREALDVPVDDPGTIHDVDTLDEYLRMGT
jgi:molybdenum cofactor cytidylyltransferase